MSKSEYVIRFSGLKEGIHQFVFEVGNKFFEQLDYSEIKVAKITATVDFEKRTNMLVVNYHVSGEVELMCDKCTDDFLLSISGEEELIYKFGEGISNDEKIIILPENEIEIDVSQPIYEVTCLAIPSKRVHPEGKCNQEMLAAMDDYLMVENHEVTETVVEEEEESEDVDPRWSALKNLKNEIDD
jgi:uncharacterized metal-binding protein YceD (DUF177 family)